MVSKSLIVLGIVVLAVVVHATPMTRRGSGEVWISENKLSPDEIKEVLKVHNDYRASIGASNMLKLRWDQDLANLAQGHADSCVSKHVNMNLKDGTRVGQNLAMSSSAKLPLSVGINIWINEKKYYNFKTLECKKDGKVDWYPCGHLTQVISARTQWIGCAIKNNCGGKWRSLLVCNYLPGGNHQRIPAYAQGTPCSDCLSGRCEGGLCACNNPRCKKGRLDQNTCTCKCKKLYSGPACGKLNCPSRDIPWCGTQWPESYCKKYGNVPGACPYMCGLC